MQRNLIQSGFLLLTIYLAMVWAKFLPHPMWLPTDVEPLTVLAGAVVAWMQWGEAWWGKILELARQKAPHYLSAPPSNLLPGIIPRTDELQQLYKVLLHAQQPVVVHGIGGLGKTTFAQLFCQRYGGKYDSVVWLHASAVYSNDSERERENAGYFLEAFTGNKTLRDNLAIVFEDTDTIFERFQKVVNRLLQVPGQNLLVIDNAPEAAARYVGTLSQLKNWRLLLTSRDAIHNMASFPLGTLSPQQAAQVFCNIYGQRSTDPMIDTIIEAYGYHTLTIELLAAYAREKNIDPSQLYQELNERGLLQLEKYQLRLPNAAKAETLSGRLLQTFLLDLDEKEREIMRYMCILPGAGDLVEAALMKEDFLCALFGKQNEHVEFHNVLRGLVRMHWLVEKEDGYRCHPVIAETAKVQLGPDAENCAVLIQNITALLVPNEETNEPMLKRAPYAPLAEAVSKGVWSVEKDFTEQDKGIALLAMGLGSLFDALGEHPKSLTYHEKSLTIREKVLPAEHPDLATSYNNMAETYGDLGEHQKSLAYHKKALAIRKKVLPAEHPDLAASYNNMAESYGALGEHRQRLAYHKKALSIWEKVLPAEHPYFATSYNNIAGTYGALGEHEKSLAYHEKALAIWEKVLPAEHPDLATSYNNIAGTYHDLGNLDQAIAFMRKAVAIFEKSLPPSHPHTAESKKSLAHFETKREGQKKAGKKPDK